MTEFITRSHEGNWFEVIIKTDDEQHYLAAQNFARSLIGHEKPCEIIHCKDCKYYYHYGGTSLLAVKAGWCKRRTRYDEDIRMLPSDFCSYGKRKCEDG